MRITAAYALLEHLSREQRHVFAAWRALVLLRRATFTIRPGDRRWEQLPHDLVDLNPLFRQMRQRGEIELIEGLRHVYEVTAPYARQNFLDEREVLFELHPYAMLSHFTALVFHGLTDDQPKVMTVTVSADLTGGLRPLGTTSRDWEGIQRPRAVRASTILGRPVDWQTVKPERFFGFDDYQPFGVPLRYTTPERTLIDAFQNPERCGGIVNVLRAWSRARDTLDIDALVALVERYDVAVLRQRVGYALDQLGLSHPQLNQWQTTSHRGGSSRLVGSEPFASTFDERWNLSLNAPVQVLHEDLP